MKHAGIWSVLLATVATSLGTVAATPVPAVAAPHHVTARAAPHCLSRTICDPALGIALIPAPGVKRASRPGQYPPHWIVLVSSRPHQVDMNLRLQVTSWDTYQGRNDRSAASAGMDRLLRGLPHSERHGVRYGGAPGVLVHGLPGIAPGTTAIILAHNHALYKILAPRTGQLAPDQRRMLAGLRFIPRVGPFPRSDG